MPPFSISTPKVWVRKEPWWLAYQHEEFRIDPKNTKSSKNQLELEKFQTGRNRVLSRCGEDRAFYPYGKFLYTRMAVTATPIFHQPNTDEKPISLSQMTKRL